VTPRDYVAPGLYTPPSAPPAAGFTHQVGGFRDPRFKHLANDLRIAMTRTHCGLIFWAPRSFKAYPFADPERLLEFNLKFAWQPIRSCTFRPTHDPCPEELGLSYPLLPGSCLPKHRWFTRFMGVHYPAFLIAGALDPEPLGPAGLEMKWWQERPPQIEETRLRLREVAEDRLAAMLPQF